jgi:hypothetical protein
VLELLVLGLIFIPLEGMFALREKRVFRAGWQTDLKHFFVSHPCWCGGMRRSLGRRGGRRRRCCVPRAHCRKKARPDLHRT